MDVIELSGLKEQYERLSPEIGEAVSAVLARGSYYLGGREIVRLERALSALCEDSCCLCCASGTDALTLALLTWDVRYGDAVFLPAYASYSAAEAVSLRGATPVFVDIDDSLTLDPTALVAAIATVKRQGWLRLAGIIGVDLFGVPADYDAFNSIAKKEGLWVLEDGSEGFGALRNGRHACTLGEISAASFYPVTPLGCCGDGGAVFTRNPYYAQMMDSGRCHGSRGVERSDGRTMAINSPMDTLQAAILLEKLKVFDSELAARRKTASRYNERLHDSVIIPFIPEGVEPSWAQYVIRLPHKAKRDSLRLKLSARGIPTDICCPKPLHLTGAFAYLGVGRGELPHCELAAETSVSLPIHPYLTAQQVEFICDGVEECLG